MWSVFDQSQVTMSQHRGHYYSFDFFFFRHFLFSWSSFCANNNLQQATSPQLAWSLLLFHPQSHTTKTTKTSETRNTPCVIIGHRNSKPWGIKCFYSKFCLCANSTSCSNSAFMCISCRFCFPLLLHRFCLPVQISM